MKRRWNRYGMIAGLLLSVATAGKVQAQSLHLTPSVPGYCAINDNGPKTHTLYVWAITGGILAARFKAVTSPGATLTYVGEKSYYPSLGSAPSGIEICLPTCTYGYVQLMEIYFQGDGTSAPNSRVELVAPDGYEAPEWANCGGFPVKFYAVYSVSVNGMIPCSFYETFYFGAASTTPFCPPVPVRERTWGAIKALYQ